MHSSLSRTIITSLGIATVAVWAFSGGGFCAEKANSAEKGLVAYWKLDEKEGEIANDSSGNEIHGKLVGEPVWTNGVFGTALAFDGNGAHINCAKNSNLGSLAQFSVELWYNPEHLDKDYWMLLGNGDNQRGFYLLLRENTRIVFRIGKSDKTSGREAILFGEWQHLVFSTDGQSHHSLYVNGLLFETIESAVAPVSAEANPFIIGNSAGWIGGEALAYKGMIQEVKVYDRVLSAEEVKAHYEKSKTHKSGNKS